MSGEPAKGERQGIAVALVGVDAATFGRILGDLRTDPAFRRPLQVQVQEPRPGEDGRLTLAFEPRDRALALSALQRLKTLMLRYGVQVDSWSEPGRG